MPIKKFIDKKHSRSAGGAKDHRKAFEKSESVFKDWIKDDDEILQKCRAHDFSQWKLSQITKGDRE